MSLPRWSVKNRILVNLLFGLSVIVGAIAFRGAVVDVYPDVSFDAGQILIAWPGASPEEVESAITRKIEDSILDTPGISRIVSHSERNRALIDVKFREDLSDADFESGMVDLRARVQRVGDLPDLAEEPVVTKISVSELFPLIQVVVTSDPGTQIDRKVLRSVAADLGERLRKIPGVQRVSDIGLPDPEWAIQLDPDRLLRHDITVLDVAATLRSRLNNLVAGTTATSAGEIAISAHGELQSVEELKDLTIARLPDGTSIMLRDVGTITEQLEEDDYRSRFDGRDCMILSIAKESDADSMDVREALGVALDRYEATEALPKNVTLATTIDTTKILKGRIRVLSDNLLFGVVLVFMVLWAFIGARNAVLAIIGIPFSFLLGFAMLSQFGISINAITLFSLMLVSGMVVDDAIVVLENIYRQVEAGIPLREAVVKGTEFVFWPVVSSTLTTIAAFLPMLVMEGVTGEFMSIIPKTVIAVLIASLFECLLVLPAHYLHWGSRRKRSTGKGWVQHTLAWIENLYLNSLEPIIKRPWIMLLVVVALTATALKVAKGLPVDLFPSDFQAFFCNVELDASYGVKATSEAVREVESLIEDLQPDQVESFTTSVGVSFTDDNQVMLKPNVAQLLVYVAENQGIDSAEVINTVRRRVEPLTKGASQHPFRRIVVDEFQDGPPTGKPVAVRVAGSDYDRNLQVARLMEAALKELPGTLGVGHNLAAGAPELRLVPDDDSLLRHRVPYTEIARTLFAANEGLEVSEVLPEWAKEHRTVRLKVSNQGLTDLETVQSLRVRTPSGLLLPLSDLTNTEMYRGPASLYHYDGERVVLITSDVDADVTDATSVNQHLERYWNSIAHRYPGIQLTFGGEFEETQKSFNSLYRAFVIAIALIFTILAAQFRSYALPLVIISVVPFSFVGVVLGLGIMGFPFTIMAFIAIVGLSGVVVNDSLVLLEFIVRKRAEGASPGDSARSACRLRMRAVLLTTITTVLGLLPMALGLTGHSRVWSPFAATITFGLSLAMFLTLYLVPSVYLLVERARDWRKP